MATLQSIPVPNEDFCVRKLSSETVFLAAKGDMIHSLDEMGTDIWETVDGNRNLGEILDLICQGYDVEPSVAEADLYIFISGLLEKDLISLKE